MKAFAINQSKWTMWFPASMLLLMGRLSLVQLMHICIWIDTASDKANSLSALRREPGVCHLSAAAPRIETCCATLKKRKKKLCFRLLAYKSFFILLKLVRLTKTNCCCFLFDDKQNIGSTIFIQTFLVWFR